MDAESGPADVVPHPEHRISSLETIPEPWTNNGLLHLNQTVLFDTFS